MIILGIDPGYVNIAYTVFNTHTKQVLETSKVDGKLFSTVKLGFESIFQKYSIDKVHIETQYCHPANRSVYSKTLERNGIILMLCEKYQVEVKNITPTALKKKITGNGKASKDDIIKIVSKYFTDTNFDNHQADALALCLV